MVTHHPIFVSATSKDLGNARDLVVRVLNSLGYVCRVQPGFAFTGEDLREKLRGLIDECGLVLQLVGFRYGESLPVADPQFGDISYTQYEARYAESCGKKVLYITLPEKFPFEKCDPEPEEKRPKQLEYRGSIKQRHVERGVPENHDQLEIILRRMRDDLRELLKLAAERHAEVIGRLEDVKQSIDRLGDTAAARRELARPVSLHQLPLPPPDFVGRGGDLEVLRARRAAGAAQITGLKGMGGIGKTALAVVLAHEWKSDFPDAQLFLDGRGTHADAPGAAKLLADAIRPFYPTERLPEGEKELRDLYVETLTGKRVLIVLDNARDAVQAQALLPPAGCALLVTSRQGFMLGSVTPHYVGVLSEPESVELLRSLCPALGEAGASAVARRCARLPLALRLAGSHLALDAGDRGGTPDAAGYLAQLNSGRLRALDTDAPDAGEVTVSETLRLSEEALPEELRDAWRKSGVFPAGFGAAAAFAVAGATDEMLRQLLRRSLIDADGPRYRLHDLAAEYARDCLSPEALAALRQSHAEHYISVLAACDELYLSGAGGVSKGLTLFDAERAHVEAAHAWLLAAPQTDPLRRERDVLLVAYPDAGAYVLGLRLHARERIKWFEAALAAARRLEDRAAEGRSLGNLGNAWAELGEAGKAVDYYEQALAVAREIGDRRGEGSALGNLGNAWYALGDARKAVDYYEQALAVSREIGDRRGEGSALGNLGNAWYALGDARKAAGYHEQHLAVAREIGDRHGEGSALGNLGISWRNLGDARQAVGYHEQHLVIAREIGDRHGEGNALGNLGLAWAALGDARKAVGYHEQHLVIAREIGDRRGEGNALGNLGNAWADLGDARKAVGYYEQRLAVAREIGDRRGEAIALFNFALRLETLDERAEAQRRAEQAAEIFAVIESPHAKSASRLAARLRGGDGEEPQD